eukprot:2587618-Prymnesium_polylepis.1
MGSSKARWATARPDGRQQGPTPGSSKLMPAGAHACNHGPTGQLESYSSPRTAHRHVPGAWPGPGQ